MTRQSERNPGSGSLVVAACVVLFGLALAVPLLSDNAIVSMIGVVIAVALIALFVLLFVRQARSFESMRRAHARGDLHEFFARADGILARTRTQAFRDLVVITKSVGLYESGRHTEGIELLATIDLESLQPPARLALLNNLLLLSAHADPDLARQLYERHRDELESPDLSPSARNNLDRALLAFRLMVHDDHGTASTLRARLERREEMTPITESTCCYYLSVIAERNGDLEDATRWYERAKLARPCMNIGPPPGRQNTG